METSSLTEDYGSGTLGTIEASPPESALAEGTAEDVPERKLTKEEKKALYKPAPPPEPYCTWRKLLKDVWIGEEAKEMKVELAKEVLNGILSGAENPYEVILGIHKYCPDYGNQKSNSLASFVIRYAKAWLQKDDRKTMYSRFLTTECKLEAYSVGTVKGTAHLEILAEIYELKGEELAEHIYEDVKKMLLERNIRDGIICATLFGLQSRFSLEELVIPAILQDRMPSADAYVGGSKEMQVELVRYFDSLIGMKDAEIEDYFYELRKDRIMTIPVTKLQGKTLEKMVSKLATTYSLPCEFVPNLTRCRQRSALRHMVYKHFVECAATEEAYMDYVSHALTANPELQRYFIKYLLNVCRRPEEAVRWVVFFDMFDHAPDCVLPYLNESSIREAERSLARLTAERPQTSENYLFPGHPIIMVDEPENLLRVAGIISQAKIVGIDTEWKPSFLSLTEQIALIQISIEECSYLIDLIELEKTVTPENWLTFFNVLLGSENCVKLGFDFANDLRVLASSFPFIETIKTKNVICMMRLVYSLLTENPTLLPIGEKVKLTPDDEADGCANALHFRLTDLCEAVLGAPLDKREQFGNWAIRPLRIEQMRYAAMDAFCLVKIFDRLKTITLTAEMDWDCHLTKGDMSYIKPKEPKKPRHKATKVDEDEFKEMIARVNKSLGSSALRRPKEIKIVVDSMMLGLGKHLRRCGIDTVLGESRSSLIQCALDEPDRYILTTGKAYDELMRNRELRLNGRVVRLPTPQTMNAIQQIECVLKYFNVLLTDKDIFSRCMNCNAAGFVTAPAPVLEAMFQANVNAVNPFNEVPYDARKYNKKMREVDPELYGGHGCKVNIFSNDLTWAVVECDNGTLDIKNCLVRSSSSDDMVEVHVEKVPPQAFEKEGRLFYVCGRCGKVYWDGYHKANYNTFADSLIEADESFD